MSSKNSPSIQFPSIEDIFGPEKEVDDCAVTLVPLDQLFPFANHPYRVMDDVKMEETVESIKKNGVLVPGIVRPRQFGGYEIIAGHRRKRACELAGLDTMPVFIKEIDDDNAAIIMVDTNIHREDLLFSEKAWAYRIKYDAMKHQGKQHEMSTAELVGMEAGESARQIKRYIRLTYLQKELLDLVDSGKIKFNAGESLSYLSEIEQQSVVKIIKEHNVFPTMEAANRLKSIGKGGLLSESMIESVLLDKKKMPGKGFVLSNKLFSYFPENYSKDDIESVLIELLEVWKGGR